MRLGLVRSLVAPDTSGAPAQPETEEQAWKLLQGYLSAHPLQPASEPTIPLGTAFAILPYLHGAVQAGLNDTLNTEDTQLLSFL